MNCGTVLHDKHFQFHNTGSQTNKLSIVVQMTGTAHFALVTTTQSKGKNREPGCQLKDTPPNFYLPQGSCWFNKETWVLLDILHEFDGDILEAKIADRDIDVFENQLPSTLLKAILNCALESPDLDGFDKGFIRQALAQLV